MTIVTNHGRRRLHERNGVTRGYTQKVANYIYSNGIRHRETTGQLRRVFDAVYFKKETANNIRFWNNSLYLYKDDILITVMKVEQAIIDNLELNLYPDAYARYEKLIKKKQRARAAGKKHVEGKKVIVAAEKTDDEFIKELNMVAKESGNEILFTTVKKVTPRHMYVYYVSENDYDDVSLFGELRKQYMEITGRKLHMKHIKNIYGKCATIEEYMHKKNN